MSPFAAGLTPPYYAVIFANRLNDESHDGYDVTAERMVRLAADMPGYLGIESVRGEDGFGITVSYWESEEAIAAWKAKDEHLVAQQKGMTAWYDHYELRVAKVERAYSGPDGRAAAISAPSASDDHD